ncbi:MBL fold metallo-hydrolase [Haliea sp. AH-315-K21]|uniref:Metallo-beta-lactamase domain-containing protein n=1 Tax=SAR86 cluster bacterium TaxID=2030880 RepID=A0A2A5CCI3_9GAMM|nr:MBL fold metallo-hydrolase [Haliea sp. AH-315-K21]PCJ41221.1 MAG: hypothetical protein COA71_09290 [SAR86 cluster bacterium]
MKRRSLLQSIIKGSPLLVLGATFFHPARSASNNIQLVPLSGSLSLLTGAGSNVLVKKASNGDLLVIDGGLEVNAEALLSTISEGMGSDNITTLMNTHWHREQTGLNAALGESGVRIFAHENTRQWLSVEVERPWEDFTFNALPSSAQPNDTFYHYGDFDHSGSIVQYGHMVQAHTDGDMYVYFPEDNILHAGGVVSNEGYSHVDWWTGGWIGGLVDGLERLISIGNQDTRIVPANGPVMSMSELLAMRDMYATIFERVRDLFMAAQSPQDTLDAAPTAEFDPQWGNSDLFVLLAHQSVLAHYAPDA